MSIKEIKWNNKQYSFNLRADRKKGKRNKKTDGKNKNQLSMWILIQTYQQSL